MVRRREEGRCCWRNNSLSKLHAPFWYYQSKHQDCIYIHIYIYIWYIYIALSTRSS
uniref:Uncharacterized protein n=1 Tax=Arundo donax TaxID=35708 RepID=A0A0A9EFT5_ARUDO